jgi:hypothetical protein
MMLRCTMTRPVLAVVGADIGQAEALGLPVSLSFIERCVADEHHDC